MRFPVLVLTVLLAGGSIADYAEIGEGGSLTTNRPFCGS